jgi:hypothetical protein
MLPLILVVIILEKAFFIIQKLIHPITTHLPQEGIFGAGMLPLLAIVILFFITISAGVWIEKKNKAVNGLKLIHLKLSKILQKTRFLWLK